MVSRSARWIGASATQYIRDVAEASRVPVLNMQCDWYHPFQALADMLTIFERFGRDLRGKTLNVS